VRARSDKVPTLSSASYSCTSGGLLIDKLGRRREVVVLGRLEQHGAGRTFHKSAVSRPSEIVRKVISELKFTPGRKHEPVRIWKAGRITTLTRESSRR